jgi:hypothetical protein
MQEMYLEGSGAYGLDIKPNLFDTEFFYQSREAKSSKPYPWLLKKLPNPAFF